VIVIYAIMGCLNQLHKTVFFRVETITVLEVGFGINLFLIRFRKILVFLLNFSMHVGLMSVS